jgi:hypothetical protein
MSAITIAQDDEWKELLSAYCDALDHLIRVARVDALDWEGNFAVGRFLEGYRRRAMLAALERVFLAHSDVLHHRREGVFVNPLLHLQTPDTAHIYLGLQWTYATAGVVAARWGFRDSRVRLEDGSTRFLKVSPERDGDPTIPPVDGRLEPIDGPPEPAPLPTIHVELLNGLAQGLGLLRTPALEIPPAMKEMRPSAGYGGIQLFDEDRTVVCEGNSEKLDEYGYDFVRELVGAKGHPVSFKDMKMRSKHLENCGDKGDRLAKKLPGWLRDRIGSGKGIGYRIVADQGRLSKGTDRPFEGHR